MGAATARVTGRVYSGIATKRSGRIAVDRLTGSGAGINLARRRQGSDVLSQHESRRDAPQIAATCKAPPCSNQRARHWERREGYKPRTQGDCHAHLIRPSRDSPASYRSRPGWPPHCLADPAGPCRRDHPDWRRPSGFAGLHAAPLPRLRLSLDARLLGL